MAQTALPDDRWVPLVVTSAPVAGLPPDNTIANAVEQPWAPRLTDSVTAPAATPATEQGCAAADYDGFPVGAIAVVVRGGCAVSLKSDLAGQAGAVALVVVNHAGGLAPSFSYGGGTPIPTLSTNHDHGAPCGPPSPPEG